MDKYSYELTIAMAERTIKRLWVLCIILLMAVIGTNIGWIYYESQFEDIVTTTIEAQQDGDGTNTVVNEGGYTFVTESQDNDN